ncbi:MAG: EamA family transporter [Alphaproteobacteria bacterium]|nr:EamA family transporter [Alphaproteobacteria bacterium]
MTASASEGQQTAAKGIGCMVLGCALLMMSDALSKWLSQTYSVGQIMSLRNVFVLVPILIVVWRKDSFADLRVNRWAAQSFRALWHVLAAVFFVTSVSLLPLADVHAIGFAGPIFIAALAPFMLGEHVGWHRWTAILVGFGGVLIMLRPTGAGFDYLGLVPLAAALSASFRDLLTRRLSRTETSISILFFSSVAVILGGLVTAPFDWKPLTWTGLALFVANGLVNAGAHFLMIEAYRLAQAPVVSPFKYSILIWAVLFGYLVWGHVPDVWLVVGAMPVVASGLYILHREHRLAAAGRRAQAP